MRLRAFLPVSVLTALVSISCATTAAFTDEARVTEAVRSGNAAAGVEVFRRQMPERDPILWNFDLALLERWAGNYGAAIPLMTSTDRLMEAAVTKSVTQEIGAALLNESIADYTGTLYEYLYINAFNALNYYSAGNFDEALVEVRRMGNKQKAYMARSGIQQATVQSDADAFADVQKSARSLGVDTAQIASRTPRAPEDADIFRDSSFARYVSAVFRVMDGDTDNARVDADVIAALNPAFPIREEFAVPPGNGRIDVLAFSGLIGRRTEQTLYFPEDFTGGLIPLLSLSVDGVDIPAFRIKFAWPVFLRSSDSSTVARIRVRLSNGRVMELPVLEDFNRAVEMDVQAAAQSAFRRSVVRSISKKAVAVAAGAATLYAAKQRLTESGGGVVSSLLYYSAYLGVVAAIAAVDQGETADVRQCRYLPRMVHAGGCTVEPGTYDVAVQYIGRAGNIVFEKRYTDITVREGQTVLVESSWLE